MKSITISLLMSLALVGCGDKDESNPGTDTTTTDVDADGDGYVEADDCDDADASAHPDGVEVCDGVDNNCDGAVDNGASDATPWYLDIDRDGFGTDLNPITSCEAPEGYVADGADCDDTNAAFNPGAEEACDDPTDYNCDGQVAYADADGDGFPACEDCDDTNEDANLDAAEVCDGVDNNCDGGVDEDSALDALTWYADADEDGFGDEASTWAACEAPEGFVEDATDCDDAVGSTYPGADEYCDEVDNNCDGAIDEDSALDAIQWFADLDGDGFGDYAVIWAACEQPEGHVGASEFYDCDDSVETGAAAFPGADEVCDGQDNDCDGESDEPDALDASVWYADSDGDGFGDVAATTMACDVPVGYTADSTDCNDVVWEIYPGADEVCDGLDNDCDGAIDPASSLGALPWYMDADSDGFGDAAQEVVACDVPVGYINNDDDCDDDPVSGVEVHPDADELCDTVDNNCDGEIDEDSALDALTWFFDQDGDNWGDEAVTALACEEPEGYTDVSGDCDDENIAASPDRIEECDGIDNDCDGEKDEGDAYDAEIYYADEDGDGYADPENTLSACRRPIGYMATLGDADCDDALADVFPGADEYCNAIDDNCDGSIDEVTAVDIVQWFYDQDEDGFGDAATSALACAAPPAYVANDDDCDDSAETGALAFPDGIEVCDGLDNNCDGTPDDASAIDQLTWYADADGDGHGLSGAPTTLSCEAPEGYGAYDDDCDDGLASVYPGADEVCDGLDNDCDGDADTDAIDMVSWYLDSDEDGYGDYLGTADYFSCEVQVGYAGNNEDCDDAAPGTNPGELEVCDDGVDNDCDGTPNDCVIIGGIDLEGADMRFIGDASDDLAGSVVASAGDVDGDGDVDVLIGAPGVDGGAGEAYLFLDPTGDVSSADAAAVFVGEDASDYAGYAVSAAGDVDGDGFADVLIGAYGDDDVDINTGAAYLVMGPISGTVDLSRADAKLTGEKKYDRAGTTVASAGDVDGDGMDDVLVGSPGNDGAGSNAGRVHLVLGPISGDFELADADARITGGAGSDSIGTAMASAGDVNGDGHEDLILGAYEQDDGGSVAGAAYVLMGPVSGDVSAADADVMFVGEAAGDRAGWSVAGAGDLDGDGMDDVLVGAYAADPSGVSNAGAAYVLTGISAGTMDLSAATARFTGVTSNDYVGVSVAAAGDWDDDGSPDVLVGGHGEDDGGSAAGAAWVFAGPFAGDTSIAAADVTLDGEESGDNAGWSVASGDVDGNGVMDLMVGAYHGYDDAGSAYLILGYGM